MSCPKTDACGVLRGMLARKISELDDIGDQIVEMPPCNMAEDEGRAQCQSALSDLYRERAEIEAAKNALLEAYNKLLCGN